MLGSALGGMNILKDLGSMNISCGLEAGSWNGAGICDLSTGSAASISILYAGCLSKACSDLDTAVNLSSVSDDVQQRRDTAAETSCGSRSRHPRQ